MLKTDGHRERAYCGSGVSLSEHRRYLVEKRVQPVLRNELRRPCERFVRTGWVREHGTGITWKGERIGQASRVSTWW